MQHTSRIIVLSEMTNKGKNMYRNETCVIVSYIMSLIQNHKVYQSLPLLSGIFWDKKWEFMGFFQQNNHNLLTVVQTTFKLDTWLPYVNTSRTLHGLWLLCQSFQNYLPLKKSFFPKNDYNREIVANTAFRLGMWLPHVNIYPAVHMLWLPCYMTLRSHFSIN